MWNMNLAKSATLAVALPLAWIELVVGSLLAVRFLPAPTERVSTVIS